MQGTVLVVPPYPYCIEELEDSHDVALEETGEGDHAWLEWSVNCFLMSMYLYILSTYLYVLPVVSTKCPWKVEIKHSGAWLWQMRLGVLNEYMARVVHKQNNAAWLPRTVHVVQPVHDTSMYLVCTEYIPVCTWIAKIILRILCFYFWQWEKKQCTVTGQVRGDV